jgi:uncharacterized membrane protein YfcA
VPAVFPLDPEQLLMAGAIVAVGSFVQASLGFGMAMLGAPLLLLIDRTLVPGPMLSCAMLLGLFTGHRERHEIDRSVAWGLVGRVLGTLPAVIARKGAY